MNSQNDWLCHQSNLMKVCSENHLQPIQVLKTPYMEQFLCFITGASKMQNFTVYLVCVSGDVIFVPLLAWTLMVKEVCCVEIKFFSGTFPEIVSFPMSKVFLESGCFPQTTEWTQCSSTCGMGVSSRVTNNNPECELVRETRLCQIRECELQLPLPNKVSPTDTQTVDREGG